MTQNTQKFKPTAGNKCAYGAMLRAHPKLKKTPGVKIVAETYIDLSEKEGYAFAGQETLESLTGYSLRSIGNANIALQELGLFSFNYRPNHATEVTPNWAALDVECAMFLDRQKSLKIELKARRENAGSAKSADPDRQSLRVGSAKSAGVISLDNHSSANPSRKQDREDRGHAALLPSPAAGFEKESANDNECEFSAHPPAETFENCEPPAIEDDDQRPVTFDTWPVDGLCRLCAIHQPLSSSDEDFASKKYYRAKRLFEKSVPFSQVEDLLKYQVQELGFHGVDGAFSIPRLGKWLGDWIEEKQWELENPYVAA